MYNFEISALRTFNLARFNSFVLLLALNLALSLLCQAEIKNCEYSQNDECYSSLLDEIDLISSTRPSTRYIFYLFNEHKHKISCENLFGRSPEMMSINADNKNIEEYFEHNLYSQNHFENIITKLLFKIFNFLDVENLKYLTDLTKEHIFLKKLILEYVIYCIFCYDGLPSRGLSDVEILNYYGKIREGKHTIKLETNLIHQLFFSAKAVLSPYDSIYFSSLEDRTNLSSHLVVLFKIYLYLGKKINLDFIVTSEYLPDIIENLLNLPELQNEIFRFLDATDLVYLASTSHALEELVQNYADDYIRRNDFRLRGVPAHETVQQRYNQNLQRMDGSIFLYYRETRRQFYAAEYGPLIMSRVIGANSPTQASDRNYIFEGIPYLENFREEWEVEWRAILERSIEDARLREILRIQPALRSVFHRLFGWLYTYSSDQLRELAVYAVHNNWINFLIWCLSQDHNIATETIEGRTLLHVAASIGNLEAIYVLSDYGSNIEARDNDGNTALHLALFERDEEMIRLLLREGADPHAPDNQDRSPYDHAYEYEEYIRGLFQPYL